MLAAMARVSTALLAVAALAALGAEAAAASPQGAIVVASSPKVQTVATRIAAHARRPVLVLGTATFTITVKNPGRSPLVGVTVSDPLSPACDRRVGTVAAGASIAYPCAAARVPRGYTNVVTVSALTVAGTRDLERAAAATTASAASVVRVRAKVASRAGVPLFTG
jgi:uncharacterized repeat protein (TIGR01451 family)